MLDQNYIVVMLEDSTFEMNWFTLQYWCLWYSTMTFRTLVHLVGKECISRHSLWNLFDCHVNLLLQFQVGCWTCFVHLAFQNSPQKKCNAVMSGEKVSLSQILFFTSSQIPCICIPANMNNIHIWSSIVFRVPRGMRMGSGKGSTMRNFIVCTVHLI